MFLSAYTVINNLSLKSKLLLMSMLVCSLPMLVACLIFMFNDITSHRDDIRQEAFYLAEILGKASSSALVSDNSKSAAEILSSLEVHPYIDSAILYGKNGREVARFMKPGHHINLPEPSLTISGSECSDSNCFNIVRNIFLNSEQVGSISLFYSLTHYKNKIIEFVLLIIAVLAVSTAITYMLSSGLMKYISEPLLHLTGIATTVSRHKDYSLRAKRFGDDEIGTLTDCINIMLSQIQERDKLLTKHREQLETLVEERTAELELANHELVSEIKLREQSEQQRKVMEEELFNSRKFESIGVLAGGIAHDFNNILTAVVGFISLARKKTDNETIRQYLENAEKRCFRAKGLTQQLLVFSRGGNPVRRLTQIAPVIHEVIDISMAGSNVKCHVKIADPICSTEIDSGQIVQALNNLLLNACQAMPNGGNIELTADNISIGSQSGQAIPSGGYLRITIADQGQGIPEDIRHMIFDPYFTTKETGTGLGLSTSYSIIKNHGGSLFASSQPGRGTTFTVLLPLTQQVSLPVEEPLVPVQNAPAISTVARSLNILVMDDEQSIRNLVREQLQHLGHEVSCASDGTEAIALYKAAHEEGNGFDIVIMDLTVPGEMGGVDATALLLEYDRNACVVVSSGYTAEPVMADFRSYGFCCALHKPYTIDEIQALILSLQETRLDSK